MRILWFVCIALLVLAVFGDLADAKKYKGDKKTKEVSKSGKSDNAVKHNKEKYLQDKQGKFEGKRDKREARQTDSSNVVEENKATKSKRKCKSGDCSKTAEVPNKKHKKIEEATLPETQKHHKSNKVQKEKLGKNKNEKVAKKHGKKNAEETLGNQNEQEMIQEEKQKKQKHNKVQAEEVMVEDKKSKKHHKKSKRSVDEVVLDALEEVLVDPPTEFEENVEVEEEPSCEKKSEATEEEEVQDVENEEFEETNKHEEEEESTIQETL